MKQTRLLKMLLAAVCLLVGTSSVWSKTTDVVETYDFEAWGRAHMNKANGSDINGYATMGTTSAGFQVNSVAMNQLYITSNKDQESWDLGSRFAVSANTTFRWGKGGSDVPRLGNENGSGARYISIIGLKAGDKVTLTCSNVKFYSTNATYLVESTATPVTSDASVTSGTEYTITGNGWQRLDLTIASSTWGNITKVIITRNLEMYEAYNWVFTGNSTDVDVSTSDTKLYVNNVWCNQVTGPSDCEGLYLQGKWKRYKNDTGLRNVDSGNRTLVVPNLKAGDIIEVYGNDNAINNISSSFNSTTESGKKIFSMAKDGNFYFTIIKAGGDNWPNLTGITVYRISEPPIADGDYYLKNKATGAYFAAGKNWGTQAITNTQGGHRIGFEVLPTGKYKLNTYIYRDQSSSSDLHYLNANFCDGAAEEWQIVDAGEGYYTISNGSGNLTGGNVNEALSITDGTGDNTKWQILTAAQRKADIETLMESATSANGVDATFYITAPGFAWADLDDRAAWQGSPTFGGFDNEGSGRFWNAEKFTNPYAAFDVYQELTGLKSGAYKITMQGFYRNGFDNVSSANDNLAILYANNSEVALKNIRYYGYTDDSHSADGFTENKSGYFVPNSQSDAAKAFNAGNFENELYVVVGNDGNLRIGVKKDAPTGANADWTVFDNFQLTYYGNTVSATITPTGYATFSSPYALDFSNQIENLDGAYYASAVETGKVTMTKLEQAVPAETGLFLKGKANETVTIPVVASGTTINGTNHLKPNTTAKEIAASTENVYHYVFAYTTSNNSNPGFFNLASPVTLGAGKAYLETTTDIKPAQSQDAKVSILFFDDNLTGIQSIDASSNVNANADKMYNLGGQLVGEGYKGIVIVNGKKVIK